MEDKKEEERIAKERERNEEIPHSNMGERKKKKKKKKKGGYEHSGED